MKIYRSKKSNIVFYLVILIIPIIRLFFAYKYEVSLSLKDWTILVVFVSLFLSGIVWELYSKIIINVETIEYKNIFGMQRKIRWSEVVELKTYVFGLADLGVISLIPKQNSSSKTVSFMITSFPIEALRDILAHLPKDCNVQLYDYLKRKLAGKQTLFHK